MARPSLDNAASLKDPFFTYNFRVHIPDQPREMEYKCLSAALPGFNLEPVEVNFHAIKLKYAGRPAYSGTFTTSFLEVRDIATLKALRAWSMKARNHDANTGSFKKDYAKTAEITLYDDTGADSLTIKVVNIWPETVGDLSLTTESSTAGMIEVTFAYDYIKYEG